MTIQGDFRRNRRAGAFIILLLAALFLQSSGCGYGFRASGRPVGIHLESLAIPMISSTSSSLGFEADFTRTVRELFISRGNVPIVPTEEAQMVLEGRVRNIETDALTFELDQRTVKGEDITFSRTSSRRLKVELEMKLVNRTTGDIVWSDSDLFDEERFEVGGNPLVTRYNQREALKVIAHRLAKRIYLKTLERF